VKTPQRGEVWLVDLGLAAKVRPALMISIPAEDVDRALGFPVRFEIASTRLTRAS
jgi:hypothetical protein